MTTLVEALPLILLLGLLASGRMAPVPACLLALTATLPGLALALPEGVPLARFLETETLRAAFLGVQPVAILAGGLLFSLAVAPRADAPVAASPRRAFLMILAGSFVESVTGFAVGAVFTLGALRAMGIRGATGGLLALLSLWLVPWGGLGPGLALGAALAERPIAELSLVTAIPHVAWMLCLPPVAWAALEWVGLRVPPGERWAQMGLQAALAALVLLAARYLPAETVALVASGAVLVPALLHFAPPRDAAAWRRALVAIGPWALLSALLLLARSWHGAPSWKPYADLPALPLTHVSVVLWVVALGFVAARPDGAMLLRDTLRRMRRPAAAMLLYVLLGRWVAGSGMATSLAASIAASLGPLAPYAIPPLGFLAGMVTGSNVGAASSLMPVQAGLGLAAGLPPWLAPGLHNFAGSVGAMHSFANTAMICGLLADGTRPAALWRAAVPVILSAMAAGWAAVALLPRLA